MPISGGTAGTFASTTMTAPKQPSFSLYQGGVHMLLNVRRGAVGKLCEVLMLVVFVVATMLSVCGRRSGGLA